MPTGLGRAIRVSLGLPVAAHFVNRGGRIAIRRADLDADGGGGHGRKPVTAMPLVVSFHAPHFFPHSHHPSLDDIVSRALWIAVERSVRVILADQVTAMPLVVSFHAPHFFPHSHH